MAYRTRTYYTDSQKALMWERWRQGWTLHQIAQLFNRAHTSVQKILSRTGDIRPPERSRSSMALTLTEREEISRAMAAGFSIRSIALILGRAPSTISREIRRNGASRCYGATRPTRPPGIGPVDQSAAGWLRNRNLARAASRRSFGCNGLRSRLQGGSSKLTRATSLPTCPTRPSTAACLFKPAEREEGTVAASQALPGHARRSRQYTQKTDAHRRIVTPSPSASGQPRLKIEQFPANGKATCSSEAPTARSPCWLSARRET